VGHRRAPGTRSGAVEKWLAIGYTVNAIGDTFNLFGSASRHACRLGLRRGRVADRDPRDRRVGVAAGSSHGPRVS